MLKPGSALWMKKNPSSVSWFFCSSTTVRLQRGALIHSWHPLLATLALMCFVIEIYNQLLVKANGGWKLSVGYRGSFLARGALVRKRGEPKQEKKKRRQWREIRWGGGASRIVTQQTGSYRCQDKLEILNETLSTCTLSHSLWIFKSPGCFTAAQQCPPMTRRAHGSWSLSSVVFWEKKKTAR